MYLGTKGQYNPHTPLWIAHSQPKVIKILASLLETKCFLARPTASTNDVKTKITSKSQALTASQGNSESSALSQVKKELLPWFKHSSQMSNNHFQELGLKILSLYKEVRQYYLLLTIKQPWVSLLGSPFHSQALVPLDKSLQAVVFQNAVFPLFSAVLIRAWFCRCDHTKKSYNTIY